MFPTLSGLKHRHLLSHSFWEIELRIWKQHGWAVLGSVMRMQSKCYQGDGHLKAWLGLETLLPPWLTYVTGKRGGCWQTDSVPLHVSLCTGCSCILTTWHTTSHRDSNPRGRTKMKLSFSDLDSGHNGLLGHILFVRSKSPSSAHVQGEGN